MIDKYDSIIVFVLYIDDIDDIFMNDLYEAESAQIIIIFGSILYIVRVFIEQ